MYYEVEQIKKCITCSLLIVVLIISGTILGNTNKKYIIVDSQEVIQAYNS